jgi:hypothetical protein
MRSPIVAMFGPTLTPLIADPRQRRSQVRAGPVCERSRPAPPGFQRDRLAAERFAPARVAGFRAAGDLLLVVCFVAAGLGGDTASALAGPAVSVRCRCPGRPG